MAESQISRALALSSYFITGCLAITSGQFLGGPLYLVNKDWYNAWIAFTKQSFGLLITTLTQFWAPTVVRVSGDKSVRRQLLKTAEGDLTCNFPPRLMLIANHQIYTDWLYLWWIGYTSGMHGRIYIILKESLRRIPVIGWGMQVSQFIFLKRNWEKDKPNLAAHLAMLNDPSKPMWLMMFPEGTNLAPDTREASRIWANKNKIKDLEHVLLPRSTGMQFCLQELQRTVPFVYDCTIGYEGVARGQYAQDIFTVQAAYLHGKPPKSVNMYWRRFKTSSIPVNDPVAFEIWLRARWMEKNRLLEIFAQKGHFPADIDQGGSGYIETQVKAFRWFEFLQIFAPIGLFALVLYSFYGQLPKSFLASINKQITVAKNIAIQAIKGPGLQNQILAKGTKMITNQPTALNHLVKVQNPAMKSFGNRKGKLQATRITNKPKPNALPSPITSTPQRSTPHKIAVKTPPAVSTKGKKIIPSKVIPKAKASSNKGKQSAVQPKTPKSSQPSSTAPNLKPATTSDTPGTK